MYRFGLVVINKNPPVRRGIFCTRLYYLKVKTGRYRTAKAGAVRKDITIFRNFGRKIIFGFQPQGKQLGKAVFRTRH